MGMITGIPAMRYAKPEIHAIDLFLERVDHTRYRNGLSAKGF